MTSEVVAVVGATGKSGSRVLAKLGEMVKWTPNFGQVPKL